WPASSAAAFCRPRRRAEKGGWGTPDTRSREVCRVSRSPRPASGERWTGSFGAPRAERASSLACCERGCANLERGCATRRRLTAIPRRPSTSFRAAGDRQSRGGRVIGGREEAAHELLLPLR